jgi:hypothetical protein
MDIKADKSQRGEIKMLDMTESKFLFPLLRAATQLQLRLM